jgi:hypothetical protein
MYRLWKENTIVFAFQTIVACIAYVFSSNIPIVAALAAFVAFLIFVATIFDAESFNVTDVGAIRGAALTAAFAAVAALFALSVVVGVHASVTNFITIFIIAVVLIAFTVVLTIAAVWRAQKEDEVEDAFPLLFVTALPLGIGTVMGGAILLYGRLDPKRDTFV